MVAFLISRALFSYSGVPLDDEPGPVPRLPVEQRSARRYGVGRHHQSDTAQSLPSGASQRHGRRQNTTAGQR